MARDNADWLQGLEIDARGNQAIVSKKENNPTAECGRERKSGKCTSTYMGMSQLSAMQGYVSTEWEGRMAGN